MLLRIKCLPSYSYLVNAQLNFIPVFKTLLWQLQSFVKVRRMI